MSAKFPPPFLPKIKTPNFGGLKQLQRILALREQGALTTDAVFISLDLEGPSQHRHALNLAEKPVIKQIAFAFLDTRDLHSLPALNNLESLISVQMFETRRFPKYQKTSPPIEIQGECVFARSRLIAQRDIPRTVLQNLHISDSRDSSKSGQLRKIVIVGHSVKGDLRILQLLGIDVTSISSVLAIIDTHAISRFVFPPFHPSLPKQPGQNFTLAGMLAQFGYRPPAWGFHNAGNDAVYTMYLMLLLAVKDGEVRMSELNMNELRRLGTIRRLVVGSLGLGMDFQDKGYQLVSSEGEATLGAGLKGLASKAWADSSDCLRALEHTHSQQQRKE